MWILGCPKCLEVVQIFHPSLGSFEDCKNLEISHANGKPFIIDIVRGNDLYMSTLLVIRVVALSQGVETNWWISFKAHLVYRLGDNRDQFWISHVLVNRPLFLVCSESMALSKFLYKRKIIERSKISVGHSFLSFFTYLNT